MCMIGRVVAVHDIPEDEPLIVHRAFGARHHGDGARLFPVSAYGKRTWAEPDKVAKSDRRPTRGNQHGLWAYFNPEARDGDHPYGVRAVVAVWGRVVEHEFGVRAEFAQVLELGEPTTVLRDDQNRIANILAALRKTYHLTTPTQEKTK